MGHLIWLFVVYLKYNSQKGEFYAGMTGGIASKEDIHSAQKLVEKRDKYHHRNKDGFEQAEIVEYSTDKDAIRGLEQMKIEELREQEQCGNIRNSISPRNPKKAQYMAATFRVFGDALITFLFFRYIL